MEFSCGKQDEYYLHRKCCYVFKRVYTVILFKNVVVLFEAEKQRVMGETEDGWRVSRTKHERLTGWMHRLD